MQQEANWNYWSFFCFSPQTLTTKWPVSALAFFIHFEHVLYEMRKSWVSTHCCIFNGIFLNMGSWKRIHLASQPRKKNQFFKPKNFSVQAHIRKLRSTPWVLLDCHVVGQLITIETNCVNNKLAGQSTGQGCQDCQSQLAPRHCPSGHLTFFATLSLMWSVYGGRFLACYL